MTEEQILKKVMEKADKGGYDKEQLENFWLLMDKLEGYSNQEVYIFRMIFSHEFAKAFWGCEDIWDCYDTYCTELWEYHLKKMVLKEDPISYLEEFI